MIKVYSKINPDKLLHIVYNLNEVIETDHVIDSDEFLQCMNMRRKKGFIPKRHKHIYKLVDYDQYIAQESWLVFKGKILVTHYDTDDTVLGTHELSAGDMNITLLGGHTLEVLEEDTIICEQKNGPYRGVEMDKSYF